MEYDLFRLIFSRTPPFWDLGIENWNIGFWRITDNRDILPTSNL
jgi:hypothetical protein